MKVYNFNNKKPRIVKPPKGIFESRHPFRRAKVLLLGYLATMTYVVKQSFFVKKSRTSLVLLLLLLFLSYSDVNEHFVLSIAMFLCLYFSYDTITLLIKAEIKNRNDQIYKDLAEGVEKQLSSLMRKKSHLIELKNLAKDASKIDSVYSNRVGNENTHYVVLFAPNHVIEGDAATLLSEELSYLTSFYESKREIFEKENQGIDNNFEFTDSKLEDIA